MERQTLDKLEAAFVAVEKDFSGRVAERVFKKLPVGKCPMIRLGHGTPKPSPTDVTTKHGPSSTLCTRDHGAGARRTRQARNPAWHL